MSDPVNRVIYLLQMDNMRMIKITELMREIATQPGEWQKRAKAVIRELDGK